MPLGHHLGAHHDVGLAAMDRFKQILERSLSPGAVAVHAVQPGGGKPCRKRLHHPLGAETPVTEVVGGALRAA